MYSYLVVPVGGGIFADHPRIYPSMTSCRFLTPVWSRRVEEKPREVQSTHHLHSLKRQSVLFMHQFESGYEVLGYESLGTRVEKW